MIVAGVAVDQDHPIPLPAQGVDGLRSRVVELGRLPDHDRPAAEDQDALEVVSLRSTSDVLRKLSCARRPVSTRDALRN
jgi:hypothetical protein